MKPVFKKSMLDNGITLVTESLPQFQSLSVGVWVNAGTRHEHPEEAGMSHFLEHMMFKGTERRSALDIALAVDRVGGEFNAFTSREYTCFHLLLLSRDYRLAADILADVLLNSTFAAEEIERERKVVLQEISMVEDNPEELVHDVFFEQAFGGHALGKPILGSPKVIETFEREAVVGYFRKHYSPGQIVVSVAGDINHDDVKRSLNRYLRRASLLRALGPERRKPNMSRPRIVPGTRVLKRDAEQAHVVIGFPGLASDHRDRFAAFLLNTYLGGGMSSALFQEIREKRGLAYTIYSSLAPFSDTGLFSVYVGTSPDEVETCLDVMGRELAKLVQRKLDDSVVEILKDNIKGTILLASDSVENRMTSIAKNEMFFGRYFSTKDVTKLLESVTAADVQRVAKKLLRPEQLILTVMGPYASGKRMSKRLLKSF